MTIMMNTRLAAGIAATYASRFFAPVNNIYLCVGAMPSDAQIDSMTSTSSSIITSALAVTLGTIPLAQMKAKDQSVGPILLTNNVLPTLYKANATKAGTIGWGVVAYSATAFSIVDVGLPNSGAALQVDTLNAVIGQPITFMSLSCKLWR